MNYKLETKHTPDYLIVKISGTVDGENIIIMVDDFMAALSKSGHNKVLLDTQLLEIKTTVLEDHQQAEYFARRLLGVKHKIANLIAADVVPESLFFETASVNRGVNLLTFTKEEDAINYLMKGTS